MKKHYFLVVFLAMTFLKVKSQVGIETVTPQGALDVASTSAGFIPPRVALTDKLTESPVLNPQGGNIVAGTIVWNTSTSGTSPNNVAPGLYYWDGAKWITFAGSASGLDWSLSGNSGTTAGTNFLGTTDAQGVRFHTNSIERARILSGGTVAINSLGSTTIQLLVAATATNDAVAASNNSNLTNSFWGVNSHATGTAILGASNGTTGVFPSVGAGVAGSANNSPGISGITGNGQPNNSAYNGNKAGYFTLDSDNNISTLNSSATAFLAGKDEQIIGVLGASSRRILYGGYFTGGVTSGQSYSYVALKYNHNNDATSTGGTNYKIVGNGTVSTLIPDENNQPRVMFCPEAPEVLFEDYGVAQLQNGEAFVKLDEIVAKSLKVDDKHPLKVFIQLEGDCNGVYVTDKTKKGFRVKELQKGISNVSFSWHIVGNRANATDETGVVTSYYEDLRLPYGPKPLKENTLVSRSVSREEEK